MLTLTEDGREHELRFWLEEARRSRALRRVDLFTAATLPHATENVRAEVWAEVKRDLADAVEEEVERHDEEARQRREQKWADNRASLIAKLMRRQ